MQHRIRGIVIRSMDYGEGNKIVTLLSDQGGKVGVMIRGAKKLRSRYNALAQPFTLGEYLYVRGSGLGTLHHGELIESHRELRTELDLAAYAAYAAELMDRALQDEDASPFMFEQLQACFTALAEGKDPQITLHVLEMKVLEASGYGQSFSECLQCGNHVGPFFFSSSLGGLLCSRCRHRDPSAGALSEVAVKLLRLFTQLDLRRLGAIQVSEATKQELKRCMRQLTDTHLGLRLKAQAFLDQMGSHFDGLPQD